MFPLMSVSDDSSTPLLSQQAMPRWPIISETYFDDLNDEQRQAVYALAGPVLVLAGAGTGKTRVLTARLVHILSKGLAYPSQILAVTFTNKAAQEMRLRIKKQIGDFAEDVTWLGTFHSIAAKILRMHAPLLGFESDFTILDTEDQLRLLKQIIQAADLDEKRYTARYLASLIDSWKNRGLTVDKLPETESYRFAQGQGANLYRTYQQRLKNLNSCDFGDLLLHNLTLFLDHPDILKRYQQKFHYMLVDEYQDTNVCQYLWLRLLAQVSQNLCVVGDDDQSIYGWRGAEVGNILRFEKDFPKAQLIRLERNYRSTKPILGAASTLISHNQTRLGKTLWTEQSGGDKVEVRGVWDGLAEARAIAQEIENWVSMGRSYADVAILVRASYQMRSFEECFISLGLPYRVIGGPRFFERAEIRDAHAYMRLMHSDKDDLAFERIVNIPRRGIGATTVQKLHISARHLNLSLEQAGAHLIQTDDIRGVARTGLRKFLQQLQLWRHQGQSLSHIELAERVLDESGYTQMWQGQKDVKSATRLENLKELIRAMGEFETLAAYLEHVSLVMDMERAQTDAEVSLMTLHSAKGLEFPRVFLPGWEAGIFPSQKSLDESGAMGLEEERRLAYVGLTRAREKVSIYFAANRQLYGAWQSSLPSRFIDELPPEHVQAQSETGFYEPQVRRTLASVCTDDMQTLSSALTIDVDSQDHRMTRKNSVLQIDMRVFHQKFGYGTITAVDGDKLSVRFEVSGHKRVLASFVSVS